MHDKIAIASRLKSNSSESVMNVLEHLERLESLSEDVRSIGHERFKAPYSSQADRPVSEWQR